MPGLKSFYCRAFETYGYSLNYCILDRKLDLASPDDVDGFDISTKNQGIKDVRIDDQDDIDQDDIDQLYGLDHYDSDDDVDEEEGINLCYVPLLGNFVLLMLSGVKVSGAGMGNSLMGLTYYSNDQDDPYITLKEEVCNAYIH